MQSYNTIGAAVYRNIPVIVPCFNTLSYAKLMVSQLKKFGLRNIILADNGSTYPPMVDFLATDMQGVVVAGDGKNNGPRHTFLDEMTYSSLPDLFCLTDPDLQFNEDMPLNFIEELIWLTEKNQIGKVGLALDLSDSSAMKDESYAINNRNYKIWEWERQFWKKNIGSTRSGDPIYEALVDTTFAVYNKKFFVRTNHTHALRVAGRYTCKHLPWYKDDKLQAGERDWYKKRAVFSFYLSESGVSGHGLSESRSGLLVEQRGVLSPSTGDFDSPATGINSLDQRTDAGGAPSMEDAQVDVDWYLKRYPDVAKSGMDAEEHFRIHGRAEGRSPNPNAIRDRRI